MSLSGMRGRGGTRTGMRPGYCCPSGHAAPTQAGIFKLRDSARPFNSKRRTGVSPVLSMCELQKRELASRGR